MLTKFKHYGWDICVFLAIFISMFIFFTGAHPLIIYDGDDWANLSHMTYKKNNGFSIADYNNPDEKKVRNLQVISK